MRPLISYEYPIEDTAKAHVEVINHKKPGCGRIIIDTDLYRVCLKHPSIVHYTFLQFNNRGDIFLKASLISDCFYD